MFMKISIYLTLINIAICLGLYENRMRIYTAELLRIVKLVSRTNSVALDIGCEPVFSRVLSKIGFTVIAKMKRF